MVKDTSGSYTQDRELSWLRFNARVLEEATDKSVPLLERLNFMAIFRSNLDEFFMIRVGSLSMSIAMNAKKAKQLEAIYEVVRPLYAEYEQVYLELEQQLRKHDTANLSYNELRASERNFAKQYFESVVAPIMAPQIIDSHHPFPHVPNKSIYIGAILEHKKQLTFGLLPIPPTLPSILRISETHFRYLQMETLIESHLDQIFNPYKVTDHVQFCVTRNGDINPDNHLINANCSLREEMKKLLKERHRLSVVRMELSSPINYNFQKYFADKFSLKQNQIFVIQAPLKTTYIGELAKHLANDKVKLLSYQSFKPQPPTKVNSNQSIIHQVQSRDILLSYPYESMEPFLRLIREAAFDYNVLSIKITIYRLANQPTLVEHLCAAAQNGKEVTVLIELRARFDEKNNIYWSERLEQAGCKVIHGLAGFKVHSKICLITRREYNKLRYITQLGTGNYNETTATGYTDFSLLTARAEIGQEANRFFKNMCIGNLYGEYDHFLVAPVSLKSRLLELIDNEITKGSNGRIFLKLNSLTDVEIMERLQQASSAGVKIRAIIRGICCLLPGIPGVTENITVTSIVGRFLEHSRIYCFGRGADEKIYLASADLMTRNTERRVEIAFPIYDPEVCEKIRCHIDAAEYDTIKARLLQSDGNYTKINGHKLPIDSQQLLMNQVENNTETQIAATTHGGLINWVSIPQSKVTLVKNSFNQPNLDIFSG